MSNLIGFKCFECSREFNAAEIEYDCLACGGNLDALYDYDRVGARLTKERLAADRNLTIWRYRELLPIEESSAVPPLAVGWTPIYDCPALASHRCQPLAIHFTTRQERQSIEHQHGVGVGRQWRARHCASVICLTVILKPTELRRRRL